LPPVEDCHTVAAVILRAVLGTAAALASTGTLWAAAEYRRSNCVQENKAGCTLLPWSGSYDYRQTVEPEPDRTGEFDFDHGIPASVDSALDEIGKKNEERRRRMSGG
jgi:hypothetical protein